VSREKSSGCHLTLGFQQTLLSWWGQSGFLVLPVANKCSWDEFNSLLSLT
jgi:hypothetical protein